MITYFVHRNGKTDKADTIERSWLDPKSEVTVWADLQLPTEEDGKILEDVFGLHQLAVQDALQPLQHPKLETYDGVLYVVLHGINFRPESDTFDTHDVDFFLGQRFLVTVHDGQRRSIAQICGLCERRDVVLGEGPVSLMHRIIDTMVEHYRPEINEIEERLDEIEEQVIEQPSTELTRAILTIKRDIAALRRIILPQRDAVSRLARREFALIDQEMSYRFRDVYDQLVRLSDDAMIFQERVTGILEAHLASMSNKLALSTQHLAAVATIFGTLTVITGMWGMNVQLPGFSRGELDDFWWIVGIMAVSSAAVYVFFRRKGWI